MDPLLYYIKNKPKSLFAQVCWALILTVLTSQILKISNIVTICLFVLYLVSFFFVWWSKYCKIPKFSSKHIGILLIIPLYDPKLEEEFVYLSNSIKKKIEGLTTKVKIVVKTTYNSSIINKKLTAQQILKNKNATAVLYADPVSGTKNGDMEFYFKSISMCYRYIYNKQGLNKEEEEDIKKCKLGYALKNTLQGRVDVTQSISIISTYTLANILYAFKYYDLALEVLKNLSSEYPDIKHFESINRLFAHVYTNYAWDEYIKQIYNNGEFTINNSILINLHKIVEKVTSKYNIASAYSLLAVIDFLLGNYKAVWRHLQSYRTYATNKDFSPNISFAFILSVSVKPSNMSF